MLAAEYILIDISLISCSPSCTNITELWNIPSAFYLYPATVPGNSNTDYQHSRKPWTLAVIFMGRRFSDITLYTPSPHAVGTPEYWEETALQNFVSDLYVQKNNGYKPPNTTRINIQPAYHGVWNRTWKDGSLVDIAPFYSHDEYSSLDKKGKYKYILNLIQTATLQLSDEYKWDRSVFEKAYKEVINCEFEFRVDYPKKMSRDRKKVGQVVIEKTEKVTTLNLLFTIGSDMKKVTLFENRNWFWYDIAYELAKNSKWLDNNTFGVYSKKIDRFGYYSLLDDVVIGKLDFKEDEFIL